MTTGIETQKMPAQADETTAIEPMERLFAAARPDAVFSEPVTAGQYTVITAREVSLGGGFGFGGGYGPSPVTSGEGTQRSDAGGSGGGGGGGSVGRPIAAIIIGPEGVKVQPIVDVTKLMLTALGTMRAVATVVRKWSGPRKQKR